MKPFKPASTPVDEREISLALAPSATQLARLGYELLSVPDMTDARRVVFAVQRMNPAADEAGQEHES